MFCKSLLGRTGFARVLAMICAFSSANAGTAAAVGPDPAPPQIAVGYNFAPSPLGQYHLYKLVYEMHITSFTSQPYTLESIVATAGTKTYNYSGDELTRMMRTAGVNEIAGTNRRVEPGTTRIVYFTLAFDRPSDIPTSIAHTLVIDYADGSRHALQVDSLPVGWQPAVVVDAPLRGSQWVAGDATHNGSFDNLPEAPLDAAHRRTILLEHGNVYLAQRYAIDWVKYKIVKGIGRTYAGPVHENASYFCYNEPIYSVAPGRIVEVLDGVKQNVPNSHTFAEPLNFINAGGNHVIVDIGAGHFAFYAHMIPGSMPSYVKVGAYVGTGTVLGHVGNSGSSTEPHLHFHIVDRPRLSAVTDCRTKSHISMEVTQIVRLRAPAARSNSRISVPNSLLPTVTPRITRPLRFSGRALCRLENCRLLCAKAALSSRLKANPARSRNEWGLRG